MTSIALVAIPPSWTVVECILQQQFIERARVAPSVSFKFFLLLNLNNKIYMEKKVSKDFNDYIL